MASSSKTGAANSASLLEPFVSVLQSENAITLPDTTLYGAITHFLSTLPLDHLDGFVKVLLESPSLWSVTTTRGSEIQQAIRLAVPAKVTELDRQSQDQWFGERRKTRAARSWLRTILLSLGRPKSHPRERWIIAGLLQGMDEGMAANVDWGVGRAKLEERVVICIDASLSAGQADLSLVYDTVHHISDERLGALQLEELYELIRVDLTVIMDAGDDQRSGTVASSLATLLSVMVEAESARMTSAWASIRDLIVALQTRAEKLESESGNDHSTAHQDAFLSAFLTISNTILDLLLSSSHPSPHEKAEIAKQIILTLASCSSFCEDEDQWSEDHHRVVYGSIDVLAVTGGERAVKRLLVELKECSTSDPRDAFVLLVGEQLLDAVDGQLIADYLYPLCSRHLRNVEHKPTLEAAHSFMLSVIMKASKTVTLPHGQSSFVSEVAPSYASLLVQQFISDDLTSDQFLSAFPQVLSCTVDLPPHVTLQCINTLENEPYPLDKVQTFRRIRIAIASSVAPDRFSSYLARITELILNTDPAGPERTECLAAAFKMVSEGLGDDRKVEGVRWWQHLQKSLRPSSEGLGGVMVRAKL